MASMTTTASFLGFAGIVDQSPVTARRRLLVARAARGDAAEGEKVKSNVEAKRESNNERRDLMFAAAAAAVCSVAGIAVAGEPKAGTPEAKKLYAPVCVTMPTARVCHK